MTFPDHEAYRAFWRAHPAFADDWTDAVTEYIDYDLVGTPPELHPATSIAAMTADIPDQTAASGCGRRRELPAPTIFLRAPRGFLDEPAGIYTPEWIQHWQQNCRRWTSGWSRRQPLHDRLHRARRRRGEGRRAGAAVAWPEAADRSRTGIPGRSLRHRPDDETPDDDGDPDQRHPPPVEPGFGFGLGLRFGLGRSGRGSGSGISTGCRLSAQRMQISAAGEFGSPQCGQISAAVAARPTVPGSRRRDAPDSSPSGAITVPLAQNSGKSQLLAEVVGLPPGHVDGGQLPTFRAGDDICRQCGTARHLPPAGRRRSPRELCRRRPAARPGIRLGRRADHLGDRAGRAAAAASQGDAAAADGGCPGPRPGPVESRCASGSVSAHRRSSSMVDSTRRVPTQSSTRTWAGTSSRTNATNSSSDRCPVPATVTLHPGRHPPARRPRARSRRRR